MHDPSLGESDLLAHSRGSGCAVENSYKLVSWALSRLGMQVGSESPIPINSDLNFFFFFWHTQMKSERHISKISRKFGLELERLC